MASEGGDDLAGEEDVLPFDKTTGLELYKLATEMADRVSSCRSTANAFFLTVQASFVTVLGVSAGDLAKASWWVSASVSLAGMLVSAVWWLQLRNYRRLNEAKFAVIHRIESRLPVRMYVEEWDYLKKGSRRRAEIGSSERVIPGVFAVLHILLLVSRFTA